MEFLNGWKSDPKMGHWLLLNRDIRSEPLCLPMTRGLIAALQGMTCGEGNDSSSSDVDGVRGRGMTREHGPESEGERWMM